MLRLLVYQQDGTGPIQLDLYTNEAIPLVFNADDFTNVAEKSSNHTKDFELPGTKHNNIFFKHAYNVTVSSDFDPHKKSQAIIIQDNITILEGYLQLNEVKHIDNEITYNVTIFSDQVNLKDILSERTLRDLDLTELTHVYNYTNITDSFTGGLTYSNSATSGFRDGGTVKYPFIRYNRNLSVNNSLGAGNEFIEIGQNTDGSINFRNVFRPWLNLYYLMRVMFQQAGYRISSTFLASNAFNKIYIDALNSRSEEDTVFTADTITFSNTYGSTFTTLDMTNASDNAGSQGSHTTFYNTTTDKVTSNADGLQVKMSANLAVRYNQNQTNYLQYRVKITRANGTVENYPSSNIIFITNTTNLFNNHANHSLNTSYYTLNNGDALEFQIKVLFGGIYAITLLPQNQTGLTSGGGTSITYRIKQGLTVFSNIFAGERGDLNQWSICTDVFKMFNLVAIQDKDDNKLLIIEPYKDYIDSGALRKWSNKVDITEKTLEPIQGLSRIVKFKQATDEDDWTFTNHNDPNTWKYTKIFESLDELYESEEDVVELDNFAPTYVTNLFGAGLYAPLIVDTNVSENYLPKPRILYDNGTYTSPIQYGKTGSLNSTYLLFSPVSEYPATPTSLTLNFNVTMYYYNAGITLNSLFNEYYSKYIYELYHKDTRIVKYKVNLDSVEVSKFEFKDVILIKGKKYRVKKIEYNPNGLSTVELITIKDL